MIIHPCSNMDVPDISGVERERFPDSVSAWEASPREDVSIQSTYRKDIDKEMRVVSMHNPCGIILMPANQLRFIQQPGHLDISGVRAVEQVPVGPVRSLFLGITHSQGPITDADAGPEVNKLQKRSTASSAGSIGAVGMAWDDVRPRLAFGGLAAQIMRYRALMASPLIRPPNL
jgi:hypothetical protein